MNATLTVSNLAQKVIFLYEMEGQLSDGKWENTVPHNHWKQWMLKSDQILVGEAVGTERMGHSRSYNMADRELLSIVGKRVRFKVALVLHDPKFLGLLEHDHWCLPDSPEDFENLQVAWRRNGQVDNYAETCLAKMEQFGLTPELARQIWAELDARYSHAQLVKDCKQLSLALRTHRSVAT